MRMRRSGGGWAVLLVLWLTSATAAVPERPSPRRIGVDEGLPSNTVNGIAEDRQGYVWFATTDGLARYDGVGMRVWRHAPGDPAALPGNSHVTAVHVDRRDRVWVALEGRGLAMLDTARRRFTHYHRGARPEMGSDDVFALASDGDAIWFGTYDGGLHRLDAHGRITRFMPRESDPRSLPSETVVSLAFDARGQLWVGTLAGLARWTGRDFERVALPGDQPAPLVYSVTAIGDALWVGAATGVFRRERDGRWQRPAWSPMFERPNAVMALVADGDGGYWIGSQREVWRVPRDGVPVPLGSGVPRPVLQMLRQSDGALWFPISGAGVGYLRPDWKRLAAYAPGFAGSDKTRYYAAAPAAAGGVWLAGMRSEVFRLDPAGAVHALPERVAAALEGRRFYAAHEDPDGRLWLGAFGELIRIDRDGALRQWGDSGAEAALPGQMVQIASAPDGTLWTASSDGGLQQRDAASGRVLLTITPESGHGLARADFEALRIGPDGGPWIATDAGLLRWNATARRLEPVPGLPAGERVHAFAFDGADALWLHRLSGLARYRRDGARWRQLAHVGEAQGLPALEGAAVAVDRHARVWLSTQRGLFRWDPRARHVRRFGIQDGLSSQEFIDRVLVLDAHGVLTAPLEDGGLAQLDTAFADPPPRTPQLVWDAVDVRRAGRWQPLPLAGGLALAPDERELRVQLRLLSYEDPASNRYSTWLVGYDGGWTAYGTSGERVLANLPPGEYLLRARAIDATGDLAAERSLRFTVRPPWWRTPAALVAFALTALLAVAWAARAYRLRVQRRIAWLQAQRERELARQASLAKTRFLATLGHEVRTPMTGVLGMSELLLATALDGQQRRYAESIRRAGEHLLRLVNDALDLARIESGKLELAEAPFDTRALVEEVSALMAPLAQRKGLAFRVEVEPAVPAGLCGDRSRVCQILLNLLGNAVKFTERGEVRLKVDALATGVRLQVCDTGPGLNEEQKSRLFRRFEQADGARTAARYGGSGLGLAICQELAAAMGGRIEVDSTPGVGTCFRVELPLPAVEVPAPPAPTSVAAPSGARTLLLVEDDATVAEVVAGLLRAQGHAVVHAPHGLAALAELALRRFDAGLLDLDLPGLDGFALAAQLRAHGFDAPLVAITARADAEVEAQVRAAGFDGFLRKPLTGAMLAEAVDALCAAARARPAPA
ncbi:MAG TPA: ATP-binding protein [Lysobacter sp.]|nr:ATP-binding protein [Lysobacter sp.]